MPRSLPLTERELSVVHDAMLAIDLPLNEPDGIGLVQDWYYHLTADDLAWDAAFEDAFIEAGCPLRSRAH